MADYTSIILSNSKDVDNDVFMYVVTPQVGDDGENAASWEGNLSYIRKSVEKTISNLGKSLDKKV